MLFDLTVDGADIPLFFFMPHTWLYNVLRAKISSCHNLPFHLNPHQSIPPLFDPIPSLGSRGFPESVIFYRLFDLAVRSDRV